MSSNSVCNHTRNEQIGHPLRGHPIFLITCMITDRIGLHSVLLPLLNRQLQKRERTGKSMVVFRLFEKLRYLNERSTKFESLYQE